MATKPKRAAKDTSSLLDVHAVSEAGGYDPLSAVPPREFPVFDVIEPEYTCPCCGYGWRGNPKPGASDVAEVQDET